MGILTDLFAPRKGASSLVPGPPADSDFWYVDDAGRMSNSGMRVTPENALSVPVVFACVKIIAETIATLPLNVYRRLPNGGREKAQGHRLWPLLHDAPNEWQTSTEWIEMSTGHLLLRGNAYSQLVDGPNGAVDSIVPLNPDRMEVQTIPAGMGDRPDKRRLRYVYTQKDGEKTVYTQDQILHLRGLSSDGVVGISPVSLMRESIALASAAEAYGAKFFSQNGRPGGVLKVKGTLEDPARDRLKKDWQRMHAGVANAHQVAILEDGLEWQAIGLNMEDMQFIEARKFQVAEIARWFRVPLVLLNETEKSTSWGSGIEQFMLAFVTYSLRPWLVRWEKTLFRDLFYGPDKALFFPEFVLDGLTRGDISTRYTAYQIGVTNGWLSPNEVREKENMNPREGGDEYHQNSPGAAPNGPQPLGVPEPGKPLRRKRLMEPPPDDQEDGADALRPSEMVSGSEVRATMIAVAAAERVLRREAEQVRQHALDLAAKPERWEGWVRAFYGSHRRFVQGALMLDEARAAAWCDAQLASVLREGVAVVDTWGVKSPVAESLVALALEGAEV